MAPCVGDFSSFGFTSPVDGGRYRVEVEGNLGDLNFLNILGDYPGYFFANPVTLVYWTMHFGRDGANSENRRITPLFLGNEKMVRGYSVNSFGSGRCRNDQGQGCAQFDRLMRSKVAIANVELRVPARPDQPVRAPDLSGLVISGGNIPGVVLHLP